VILRVPPNYDRVVVREAGVHVADDEQERALARQAAVGTKVHRRALHLTLGERLVQRPLQRPVLLPARILVERRQQEIREVLQVRPTKLHARLVEPVDIVVDQGDLVFDGIERVVDRLVGTRQPVERADLPIVERSERILAAVDLQIERQDRHHSERRRGQQPPFQAGAGGFDVIGRRHGPTSCPPL
jgi:hypothetical protein